MTEPVDPSDEQAPPRPNVVQISTYTPAPGADVGIRSQVAHGGPVVFARRVRPWRMLLLVVVVGGLLATGGVWVYRTVDEAQRRTTAHSEGIGTTVAPTSLVTEPTTIAPPPTLPPVGNLLDATSAALINPAVEAAAPGEPSQFTSIAVYPAYAVATVRDPDNAARTIRLTIRGADVVADEPMTQNLDLTQSLFTVADVDWSVVPAAVGAAPAAAGVPADTVDHVVVQRWGFDPAYPMRILVYLSGGQFVEAGPDGAVIAVH